MRLSTTTTSCPAPSSRATTWLPMNPHPPVTTTRNRLSSHAPVDAPEGLKHVVYLGIGHVRMHRQADLAGAHVLGGGEGPVGVAGEDRLQVQRGGVDLTAKAHVGLGAEPLLELVPIDGGIDEGHVLVVVAPAARRLEDRLDAFHADR